MDIVLAGVSPHRLQYFTEHTHDSAELVVVLEGSGVYRIADTPFRFSAGSVLCIPPAMPHTAQAEEQFRDLYLQISDFPLTRPAMWRDDEENSVRSLMQYALRTFYKKEANHTQILRGLAQVLYQVLQGRDAPAAKNADADIEHFKNTIITNFTDPEFTIQAAYRTVHFCPDYFRRRFKKQTGQLPGQYLTGLRIGHARRLLEQNAAHTQTIAEIALLSGFYDQRYFSQLFKRHTGKTPLQYQAAHADAADRKDLTK